MGLVFWFVVPTAPVEEFDEEDDLPLARLVEKIRETGFPIEEDDLHLYLDVDSELATHEMMSDEAIIREVRGVAEEEEEEEEEEDAPGAPGAPAPPPTPLLTVNKAMEMLQQLRAFANHHSAPEQHLNELMGFEGFVQDVSSVTFKQKTIKDFFK